MPTFDPTDSIGRAFLLLQESMGRGIEPRSPEKLWKSLTRKVVIE